MKIHSRFRARPWIDSLTLNHFNLVFKFYRTAMNRFNAQDSMDSSVIKGAHCVLHSPDSWSGPDRDHIREIWICVVQHETCCAGPRLGIRTVVRFWTMYVNRTDSELSAWFETRCISVQFVRFWPRIFEVRTIHVGKPWRFSETGQKFFLVPRRSYTLVADYPEILVKDI